MKKNHSRHFTLIFLKKSAEAQNRTGDARIFSPALYQLSYLGKKYPKLLNCFDGEPVSKPIDGKCIYSCTRLMILTNTSCARDILGR